MSGEPMALRRTLHAWLWRLPGRVVLSDGTTIGKADVRAIVDVLLMNVRYSDGWTLREDGASAGRPVTAAMLADGLALDRHRVTRTLEWLDALTLTEVVQRRGGDTRTGLRRLNAEWTAPVPLVSRTPTADGVTDTNGERPAVGVTHTTPMAQVRHPVGVTHTTPMAQVRHPVGVTHTTPLESGTPTGELDIEVEEGKEDDEVVQVRSTSDQPARSPDAGDGAPATPTAYPPTGRRSLAALFAEAHTPEARAARQAAPPADPAESGR